MDGARGGNGGGRAAGSAGPGCSDPSHDGAAECQFVRPTPRTPAAGPRWRPGRRPRGSGRRPAAATQRGAEPLGHRGLQGRRPHVVPVAVGHQHRQVESGELVGAVRLGEQLLGDPPQRHRMVGDEPPVHPVLDLRRWRRRSRSGASIWRLATQIDSRSITGSACASSADVARPRAPGSAAGPESSSVSERIRGRVGQRGRARRRGRRTSARPGAPAAPMAPATAQHVLGERLHVVRRGVVVARRLVLAALVERDHRVTGRRDRRQDRDEVLLGPGVARHEQRRGHRRSAPGRASATQRGQRAPRRRHGRGPDAVRAASRNGGVLIAANATRRPVTRARTQGQAQWRP